MRTAGVVGKMTSALAVVYDAMTRESNEGGGAHRARASRDWTGDLGAGPNATRPEATGEFPARADAACTSDKRWGGCWRGTRERCRRGVAREARWGRGRPDAASASEGRIAKGLNP